MKREPMPNMTETNFVEIFGGVIGRPVVISGANGRRLDFASIGSWRFFVDVIDEEGFRISMWDGASYEEAIKNAEELSGDGFGPVVDNLLNGGAA
ncbi:hypothetical protein [Sinorhizobium meliloti]|uniref:hypothetical protein n=1 Tax=Rhizobium meliloti TaxID=382 RepID=UPI000FE06C6C|nr:hypothetical protein [Sinorhizobium meliloti]RVO67049.1 hypothetical protein CN094_01280 [Sinorhizobium meliloti]